MTYNSIVHPGSPGRKLENGVDGGHQQHNPPNEFAQDAQHIAPPGKSVIPESLSPQQYSDRLKHTVAIQSALGDDKLLSVKEALRWVPCSKGQFSKLINGKVRGLPRLRAVRLGRRVFVRLGTLKEWLREIELCSAAR